MVLQSREALPTQCGDITAQHTVSQHAAVQCKFAQGCSDLALSDAAQLGSLKLKAGELCQVEDASWQRCQVAQHGKAVLAYRLRGKRGG